MDEINKYELDNETEDILTDIPKAEDFTSLPDVIVNPSPVTPPPAAEEEEEIVMADDFGYAPREENVNSEAIDEEISEEEVEIDDDIDFQQPLPYKKVEYYTPNPAKDPSVGGSKKGLRIFALVLAAVILCIGSMSIGFFSATLLNDNNIIEDGESSNPINDPDSSNNGNGGGSTSSFPITQGSRDGVAYDTMQNVAAKVSPSVVNITTYNASTGSGGYASGIIMTKDGYILTNDHIYASIPNAKFLITLNDGTEYKAEYVSGDTRSDIAILKITDSVKNLVPANFGKSSEINVGETVLAIGQSSGLSGTVSEGIVSALNRRVRGATSAYSERHIQTTAAINPGNSGGALVNMQGQVIGVTSSKYVDENVEGICFAIPIDSALKVVAELQKHGKVVSRAKLGITYTAVGTVASEINKTPTGLYIQEISSESGLYGKGFVKGDVITHINGEVIKDDRTVLDIIESSKAGDVLELTIYISSTAVSKSIDVKLVAAEGGSSYSTQEEKEDNSSSNVFDVIPNPDNE